MVSKQNTHSKKLGRPIQILFLCYLGFIFVLSGLFFYLMWRQTKAEVETELAYQNQLALRSTESIFNYFESALDVVGRRLAELDQQNKINESYQLIQQINAINEGMAGFGLARTDGQLLIVSNLNPDQSLPNLLDNPANVESFQTTLDRPGLHPGRTYYMETLGTWVIPVRLALRNPNEITRYVMTAGLNIMGGNTAWQTVHWSEKTLFQVIRNQDGYIQFQNPIAPTLEYEDIYNQPIPAAQMEWLRTKTPTTHDTTSTYWNVSWSMTAARNVSTPQVVNVTYLPAYDLYLVVSQPMYLVWQRWLINVQINVIVMTLLIGLSVLVYFYVRQLQSQVQTDWIYHATHDLLTGLPNRLFLSDYLEQVIAQAQQQGSLVGIFFIDLDHFKRVNDSFGHDMGDKLLQDVGQRLRMTFEPQIMVARQGGDEFIVVSAPTNDHEGIEDIARQVIQQFREPFLIQQESITITPSIGVSIFPIDAQKSFDLLRHADTALYNSKDNQRGMYLFYNEGMNQVVQRRFQVENALRCAVERKELQVYYQPKIDIIQGQVVGCEALVRWFHEELGQVSPAEFIPIAEDIGVIDQIGAFVLQTACDHWATFQTMLGHEFRLSVNVSAKQLLNTNVVELVQAAIAFYQVPPHALVIEITESVFIHDFLHTRKLLQRLSSLGVSISIDDFGTGYSSLSYLNRLPVSELKIDRSFIRDILVDENDAKLAQSIINLGLMMGVEVIAEGVETAAQAELLQAYHCRYIQGYYISCPLSFKEFQEFLIKHSCSLDYDRIPLT
ncbi:putative bifunctional diguanylate cyclase/phosphodiesterase [Spirulina major]|uniref:putative bifunctional diguanylate cyclase/phosphodiesterase n=1 Tax=Spirulina major TaxID=270636 RepID=UPI0009352224|nr:bifunctional diguanylate cyclase/phosphodiesterase [Spirulina major]